MRTMFNSASCFAPVVLMKDTDEKLSVIPVGCCDHHSSDALQDTLSASIINGWCWISTDDIE